LILLTVLIKERLMTSSFEQVFDEHGTALKNEDVMAMDDFTLNRALAQVLGFTVQERFHQEPEVTVKNDILNYGKRNYCDVWDDIMPIAMDCQVTVVKGDVQFVSAQYQGVLRSSADSPQRALAQCCLLVLLRRG
jgi:hypothetical protein